jgi:HD-like signal output (HDOD) protein
VKTLEHAIVVLGEEALNSLVLAACLKGLNNTFGPVEKMLWEDAVGCSFAARLVAKRLASADAEEAFLGGLFRNLGKLVLNNLDGPGYRRMIEAAARDGRSPDELESASFPCSHMLIGAAVLVKWKFPGNLIHAVRYYLTLERFPDLATEAEGLMATVNIADDFCRRLGIGRPGPESCGALGQTPGALLLGADDARLEPVLKEFAETFQRERATVLF